MPRTLPGPKSRPTAPRRAAPNPALRVNRAKAPALPIYRAIEERIRELIAEQELAPGDRIPSERALADELNANRMTVRKAMDRLVAAGVLERNSTAGTRVAPHRVTRPIGSGAGLGISRVVAKAGGIAGSQLLYFEQACATAKLASRLRIAEGDEVVVLRRLLSIDGTPFCIETSQIPAALVPELHAEDLTKGQSLYALLHERYGIDVTAGEREISTATATQLEARHLLLAPGTSVLLMRLLAFDRQGRPVEFMSSVNHPQLVVFRTPPATLR